jgi:hypothetical protein
MGASEDVEAFEQALKRVLGSGDRFGTRCGDREVSFRSPASLRSGLADPRRDKAFVLEPLQGCIQRARRYRASCVFGDLGADRHAVGLVTESKNRQKNELLEFAEIDRGRHMSCIVVKLNELSSSRKASASSSGVLCDIFPAEPV